MPHHDKDRYLAPDVAWAKAAVLDGALSGAVQERLFSQGDAAAADVSVGANRLQASLCTITDDQPQTTIMRRR